MVLLLTMQIAGVSLPNWIGQPSSPGFAKINFLAGLVAAVVFILLTLWGGKWFRRCAILAGLIVGTACYSGFVPISFAPVVTSPWIVVPRVFPFGFGVRLDAVVIFIFVLVPSSIASMALYQVVANWGNEKITSLRMSEGCFAVAIGAIIAAAVGTFSTTVYPDNMGMLRSTRVGSRYGTAAAGVLLVVLGSCVKFDMLLVMVPIVVLAGVATVLFGIVMVHGIRSAGRNRVARPQSHHCRRGNNGRTGRPFRRSGDGEGAAADRSAGSETIGGHGRVYASPAVLAPRRQS